MKHKVGTATKLARRFLTPGDAVLEIGAADGVYTRVYADQVGPSGHVWAVEPHPAYARELSALEERRPWLTVYRGAVGARVHPHAWLYTDATDPKRSSLWRENVPDPQAGCPVLMTTIDTLVAAMPRVPRLIQVDAQGAEAAILAGARMTLTLPIVWVIELWAAGLTAAGASVSEVMEYFQSHAYTPRSLHGAHVEWTTAHEAATAQVGGSHTDLVMVPEDLMEADW